MKRTEISDIPNSTCVKTLDFVCLQLYFDANCILPFKATNQVSFHFFMTAQ